ncbi:ADP-ribose pyrophosphatase YjhB (NUDIX family) [Paenibacillus tundrae]|uniref:ADP-ribose pyrophosphatase YjhB (NUDIX family) n=1 Tax=Paenibacillus tundrae TaxID=528187 RepID=A0ABT9W884_9BACL|nr:ADP-ribose pyrophosphatase YjhB (NUDIX family) [Paenibacillus tundrae]|eukprot:TRINITY_DN34402_c0_g1_i1.p1 TRINITY_DN34402_c0_g1~~TRINITY_DN34402_c0_g1_i1.p1  ORF type:complete len:200 (+),score=1.53 TRINITY_DN34402_c0_g1_i1:593-1192(+)
MNLKLCNATHNGSQASLIISFIENGTTLKPADKTLNNSISLMTKEGLKLERKIRNSAKALIIQDGRMLALKHKDDQDVYYTLPGGTQNAGEALTDAVKREVAEEIGVDVEPLSLEFVNEGVYGEALHRVDFFFLCKYRGMLNHANLHNEPAHEAYEWLEIQDIMEQPLNPSKLRKQIQRLVAGEKTVMYLGNEEHEDSE